MKKYVTGPDKFQPMENDDLNYECYAVSCHSGSLDFGHYWAYAKHPYTGEWREFNDSSVSSMSEG